jgi:tetrahedral aminopeptidase
MDNIAPFLKELISLPGLSGYEDPVRQVIARRWQPLVDELSVSKLGSLHGLKRAADSKGSILLAAHMDAIGLMVDGYNDGLLRVVQIGGVDPRILPGQPVIVHGKRDLPGVAILLSDRLLANHDHKENAPDLEHIFIDTGLSATEIAAAVELGSLVSFATPPTEMEGGYLFGHSLDNRASVAAVTLCLEELAKQPPVWNIWAVATVQEEVTLGGSATSAFALQPDLAIAIDVTFGRGPGASDYRSFPLGGGVTIGVGSNIHPYLEKQLKQVAKDAGIPFAIEVMSSSSGTDAIAMQVAGSGIPCEVVGIPLRYMHTPVEEVAYKDIEYAGHLLARFISSLDDTTMTSLQKEMLE